MAFFANPDGTYTDKELHCLDCKCKFTFAAGEQMFFDSKQFSTAPKRCKPCREAKKVERSERDQRAQAARPAESQDRRGSNGKGDKGGDWD